MEKVKWFLINWDNSFDNIVENILLDNYKEDKCTSYKSFRRRAKELNSLFIHKKNIIEKIENPITNEIIEYHKILFEKTYFNLYNSELGLEIKNPGKSYRELCSNLSLKSDFNISIKEPNIDLLNLVKNISSNFTVIHITQIICKNLSINDTLCNIEMKNERDSILKDFESFIGKKKCLIQKIKCTFEIDNLVSSFEITHNGLLKTKNENLEALIPIIKQNIM